MQFYCQVGCNDLSQFLEEFFGSREGEKEGHADANGEIAPLPPATRAASSCSLLRGLFSYSTSSFCGKAII